VSSREGVARRAAPRSGPGITSPAGRL